MGGTRLDALARDLAGGRVSRRTALKRAIGGAAGLAVPSVLMAEPALARCPPSRKCGSKCCPPGQRCKNRKCKCKGDLTRCGKDCIDVATDPANCGACGRACAPGQTCAAGQCTGGGASTTQPVCGDGKAEGSEICDGADLKGATCQSLGFIDGTLACGSNCTYDTSGCTSPSCATAADCPQGPAGDCQQPVCVSGNCGFAPDNADLPVDGNPCTDDICTGGVPSNPPKASGTSCGSGPVCNGSGGCVGCLNPSTCPQPASPACATATCVNNTCGFSFQPAGTQVSCTSNMATTCNGSGGTQAQSCTGFNTCGGGGNPLTCGCTPMTKQQACGPSGQVCGTASDGCGGQVSCGACAGRCCFDSCICATCLCP